MIYLFLEYVPEEIIKDANEGETDYFFVALTPLACYQLDEAGLAYAIPEDYAYPRMEYDFKSIEDNLFCLSHLEVIHTFKFWMEFVKNIKINCEKDRVIYFGKAFAILKEECRRELSCYEEQD